jgi:hypothetical protein
MQFAKRFGLAVSLASVAVLPMAGCNDSESGPVSPETKNYSAVTATRWMDLLYDSIQAEGFSPPVASRAIGCIAVAGYEAVVPGMPGHRSLGGQLNEFPSMPAAPNAAMHWPSSANAAMATVMREMFVGRANAIANIDALEADIAGDFGGTVPDAVISRSVSFGDSIGMAVATWTAGDGYDQHNNAAYTIPMGPGLWEPTPPAFSTSPVQPEWGRIRPMVMLFGSEKPALPPPAYSEAAGSPFRIEAEEVRDTVANLTTEQMDIASFWADNPGATGTPPGHWVSIVSQISTEHNFDLGKSCEAFARVGLAVCDAFIACWDMKYYYNLVRPVTYIRNVLSDPTWVSPIGTPPFPEYPSGHSTQSGAAAQALTDMLGPMAFTDNTHAGVYAARSFTDFFHAADEAAISRLYGGIHFRAAIVRGVEQGRAIGELLRSRIQFRK